MKDPILLNNLWKEVEAGRVSVSQTDDLFIFKYTQETHIKDLWNDTNRVARGIVFRSDGTVVARPFAKFFNLHERPETEPNALPWDEGVEVYEKLDGSCGAGYVDSRGNWSLATPGSLISDQAVEGTRILHEGQYDLSALPLDCTPVFEIIYPENRIVVDYSGRRELVLLAIFEHNGVEWHPARVDRIATDCGFARPKRYEINLRDEIPFEDNHEGYVVRFGNGFRVKVKSPAYLRVHRILNHMSPKGVIDLIRGKEYGVTVGQLPKELAKEFDDVRAYVQGIFNEILTNAHGRLNLMLEELGQNVPRKNYAIWVSKNVPNAESGFVFALLDGKDIEDKIWKLVLERVTEEPPVPA